MFNEIEEVRAKDLLNQPVEQWCEYFEERYKLNVPKLVIENIEVDNKETDLLINNFGREPILEKGTEFLFHVPFEGDPELFNHEPSSSFFPRPEATILNSKLILAYERRMVDIGNGGPFDPQNVRKTFDQDLEKIQRLLQATETDVTEFNSSIREKVRSRLESRNKKLAKDQELVANLGFPLKRRDEELKTYIVPEVRRKMVLPPPTIGSNPTKPEPTLDNQQYEDILSVLRNMVLIMERSPEAFKTIGEEAIRTHFLVSLNGLYEGQATGETFNGNGKTDILIRWDNRNIFIAECKIWDGSKLLTSTIDQLLGYVSWRDTKTAILIFNRNSNFSSVLAKIPEVAKDHPQFKAEIPNKSETEFRFKFHYPEDRDRELMLTIMAFDIPR